MLSSFSFLVDTYLIYKAMQRYENQSEMPNLFEHFTSAKPKSTENKGKEMGIKGQGEERIQKDNRRKETEGRGKEKSENKEIPIVITTTGIYLLLTALQ